MTDPVCGALTHKRTPCQNTLVTGCGLCPVHASQLRAANTPFKHIAKPRRKKSHSSNSSSQDGFPRQQYLAHALLQEGFLCNLPVPQHHALSDASPADDSHILDILKADPIVVSPVTPKTADSVRHPLFHDDEQPLVDVHPAHDNDLQPPPDPFLLEVDLPIDLAVPKFD